MDHFVQIFWHSWHALKLSGNISTVSIAKLGLVLYYRAHWSLNYDILIALIKKQLTVALTGMKDTQACEDSLHLEGGQIKPKFKMKKI